MATAPSEHSRYSQETAQPLQQQGGGLSREPSYVRQHEGNGEYSEGNRLSKGTSYIPGQENYSSNMNNEQMQQQHEMPQQAQGEREYMGRDHAQVVPHGQFQQQLGHDQHPHGLEYGQSVQTADHTTHQRSIGEPVAQMGHEEQQHQQQEYNGEYAQDGDHKPDMALLQPSRSYSQYGQQQQQQHQQPIMNNTNEYAQQDSALMPGAAGVDRSHSFAPTARTEAGMAGVGAPIATQMVPNATAVGSGTEHSEQEPQLNGQASYPEQNNLEGQRMSSIGGAPTTAVQPLNTNVAPSTHTAALSPVGGGGLAAALATSGHSLTSKDKKALKSELKTEQKFERQLANENKQESDAIGVQLKLAKLSIKNADKSGRYEAGYRKTHDKAIQREIKAKKYLLKVQNEYNKVAADLESATKEMEIRRNKHIADNQTRDADQAKLEDLRNNKGRNDMQREARHGDSLTKQAQAKRALSMSKRKSLI